jgi:hypothetical protein
MNVARLLLDTLTSRIGCHMHASGGRGGIPGLLPILHCLETLERTTECLELEALPVSRDGHSLDQGVLGMCSSYF